MDTRLLSEGHDSLWKNLFKIHLTLENVFKKHAPGTPNFHFTSKKPEWK